MDYLFCSDRLGFRNWRDTDYEPFAEMNADTVVTEFFPAPLTKAQSDGMIDRMKIHFETHGYTFYAVDELKTGLFIGFLGLVKPTFDAFFTPCVEIGWRFATAFWNQGYATEGAKRVIEHAFGALGLDKLYAITAIPNKKSARIMEKAQMQKIGEFDHPQLEKGHILERHVVYQVRKND